MGSTAMKAEILKFSQIKLKKLQKMHELLQRIVSHITAGTSSYAAVDTDEKQFVLFELWRVICSYQNS